MNAQNIFVNSFMEEKDTRLLRESTVYLDAHYLWGAPSAIGVSVGAYLDGSNLEGYVGFAKGGESNVTWYYLGDISSGIPFFTQTYKPRLHWGGSIGYGFLLGDYFRLTPRVGADVLSISAKESGPYSHVQKTYVLSGTASVRAELALSRHLAFSVVPGFSIPVSRGATAERLSTTKDTFRKWNGGFTLQAGLCLNF